jgi:ABC-type transporter Mla MlaB component
MSRAGAPRGRATAHVLSLDDGELEIHERAWPALARAHLAVRGPIDARTRTWLIDAVRRSLEPGHRVALDLSEVTAIDAGGAQAVRDCGELAARHGAELTVQDPSPAARRALLIGRS